MILVAYLDESGTHRLAKTITMGGYLGTPSAWREFNKRWNKALVKQDISHLHMNHLLNRRRLHEHWSRRQFNWMIDRIFGLTCRHLLCGFTVQMEMADFREVYRNPELAGLSLDSAYGLCFRTILSELSTLTLRSFPDRPLVLNFVLEAGHRHAGGAKQVFRDYKERGPVEVRSLLGAFSLEDKKAHGGLQVADAITHTAYRLANEEVLPTWLHPGDIAADYTIRATSKDCQLFNYRLGRDGLAELRERAVAHKRGETIAVVD